MMLKNLEKYRILLASASPRRRELISMLDIPYQLAPAREIEEVYPDTLKPEKVSGYLAALKAEAYRPAIGSDDLVITADTTVICDGRVIGKPRDKEDACAMLHFLSGKTHTVVTGVAVTTATRMEIIEVSTKVRFDTLTDEEISYYVDRYKPLDKAGAYGIQEWIGAVAIKGIEGSYYNVMGLPVNALYNLLKNF